MICMIKEKEAPVLNFYELVEKQTHELLKRAKKGIQQGKNSFSMYVSETTVNQAIYATIDCLNKLGYNAVLKNSQEYGCLYRELKIKEF